jgi:hypothetical protein
MAWRNETGSSERDWFSCRRRRTGKHEPAQEHLATAMEMYRGMGMTYWLEQAEAQMKEQG